MLPAARDNLLAAIVCEGADGLSAAGLAYADVATGTFACCAWAGPATDAALRAELRRLAPAEVLLRDARDARDASEPGWRMVAPAPGDAYRATPCPASYFDPTIARAALTRHFGVPSLAAFGCEQRPLAAAAAGAIVAYLQRMKPTLLRLVTGLRTYDTAGFVEIDPRTWRTLEVVEPAHASATSAPSGDAPRRCSPRSTPRAPAWARGCCAAGCSNRCATAPPSKSASTPWRSCTRADPPASAWPPHWTDWRSSSA